MIQPPPDLEVADPLGDLIRQAAPMIDQDLSGPAVGSAIAGMLADVTGGTTARPTRRWQRRVAGVGLGTALIIGGGTTVAAATGLGVWRVWFDSPNSTESIRDEAYLSTSSPEFASAFDEAALDYPLPPGKTYDQRRREVLSANALKQVTGMRGELAAYSGCAWSATWLDADQRHDARVRRTAARELARIAKSPDLAAIDGGGIVTNQEELAAAAAAGDSVAVAEHRFCGEDR
jgi:hypothetical protein